MMHTKNRAIQMITRVSDSVNGLEIWTRFLEELGAGEQRSIPSDADAIAAMSSQGKQRSSLGGVGMSCTAVRGAVRARSGTQSKQQYWHATNRIQSGADASD